MDERKGAIMRKNYLVKLNGKFGEAYFNVYTNSKKAAERIGVKMYANCYYCDVDDVTYCMAMCY